MVAATKAGAICKALASAKVDAAMFFDEYSIYFFTGFQSTNALYLITPERKFFLTDGRYIVAAEKYFLGSDVLVQPMLTEKEWQPFFQKNGINTVGASFSRITASRLQKWHGDFGIEIHDFSAQEDELRNQKSAADIKQIEATAKLADKALSETLPLLKPGISEREFAWQLEKRGRELGAEAVSFSAIVAFGEHGASPHHHVSDRKLKKNEAVLIDWGFILNGFCSDCTRCFFVGNPLHEWVDTYEQVLKAQTAGIKAIQSGKAFAAPHKAAVQSLGEEMIHSFGHGVGVEVHEYPGVSMRQKGEFQKNMVVTAEPGLYLAGKFGIRIEDLLVVTETGCRSLTTLPKDIERAVLRV